MAKIFFPYIDRPKEFPFLLGRQIRFPFIVEDLVYYWTFTTEGITLYLHSADISEETPILKDILLEDTGITFYLANGSAGAQATLIKAVYVEFEQIGKGIHTLGRLDPLTLGDIDPFTLGEISNVSASWKALRNAIATTMSNIITNGDNAQMHLKSDAVVATEKAIFTGELSSFIHTTGLTKQRVMTLGELDPHVLEDIDMMLTTFRVFEDVPAGIVKFIGVAHRDMLKNALSETAMDASISVHASAVGIGLGTSVSASVAGILSAASSSTLEMDNRSADCDLGIIVIPDEHQMTLLSSEIAIEVSPTTEIT